MALEFIALRAATASVDDGFDDVRQYAGGEPLPLTEIDGASPDVSVGFDSVLDGLLHDPPAAKVSNTPEGTDVSIDDDFDELVDAFAAELAAEREQWDGETVVAIPGWYADSAAERLARRTGGPRVTPTSLVRTDVATAIARGLDHADGTYAPEPHPVAVVEVGLFNTTTAIVEVNVAENRVRVQDRYTVDGGSHMIDGIIAKEAIAGPLDVDPNDVAFDVWGQVVPTVWTVREGLSGRGEDGAGVIELTDSQYEVPVLAADVQQEVTELVEQTTHNLLTMIDNSGYRLEEIGAVCLTGLGVRTPGGDAYVDGIRSRLTEDLSGGWVAEYLKTGSRYAPERGAALLAQRELDDSTDAFDVYDDQ
jgi:hypothetical protein